MAIIPTVRCRNMRAALAFYTGVLDFERVDGDDTLDDPCFSALARGGDYLFLSSHRGDGAFGQAIAVLTDEVDALFRELYVDDPDGNTLRFTQGFLLPRVSAGEP
jgi:catechol 2,3-dioxygenase-like lactoylglutathione lyase family enzyme